MASVKARQRGQHALGSDHLLAAVLEDTESSAVQMLVTMGIDHSELRKAVVEFIDAGKETRPIEEHVMRKQGFIRPKLP